jgi:hypothetical protein
LYDRRSWKEYAMIKWPTAAEMMAFLLNKECTIPYDAKVVVSISDDSEDGKEYYSRLDFPIKSMAYDPDHNEVCLCVDPAHTSEFITDEIS